MLTRDTVIVAIEIMRISRSIPDVENLCFLLVVEMFAIKIAGDIQSQYSTTDAAA